jgi:hypothetical protein
MANSWFRLYAEFAHDHKVQMLSEQDQRRLIMMFCLKCNGYVTLQDDDVTFQLRISNDEWQKTKDIFIKKGFINSDNQIINWDKRQYVTDSSTARVARHRERKKNNTDNVTSCNVTVTPPEQNRTEQNRADTEQIKKKNNAEKSSKEITDIFEHWQNVMNHKKTNLDKARIKAIDSALKLGYSTDEIKQAINGCSLTPFNMGKNDNGEVYNKLPTILKNADQIDRFISNAKNPPKQSTSNYQRQTGPSEAEWNNADFMSEPGGEEPPLHLYNFIEHEDEVL